MNIKFYYPMNSLLPFLDYGVGAPKFPYDFEFIPSIPVGSLQTKAKDLKTNDEEPHAVSDSSAQGISKPVSESQVKEIGKRQIEF